LNWVEQILKDENKALRQLYAENRSSCIQWLTSKGNVQLEDAKEIFQTAVIVLYDNVKSGKLTELSSSIQTYLIGICKNKAFELYRRKKKTSLTDEFPTIAAYMDEEIENKQELELKVKQMNTAMNGLGDPCRSILQFFYYKRKSMDDITKLMGYKNVATTKNLKYKCVKRLQSAIKQHKVVTK
jgi:RNA polymerase sigma-70 factor (ECF subfamily)